MAEGLIIVALQSDGSPNTSFDSDGIIQTQVLFNPMGRAHVLTPARRIVVAGGTSDIVAPVTGAFRIWF